MPSKNVVLADTLSRAPISEASTEIEFRNVNVIHELVAGKLFCEKIKRATKEDVTTGLEASRPGGPAE